MEKEISNAYKETLEILENSNQEIIEKVPEKIFKYLKNNINDEDKQTKKINFEDENWKEKLDIKTKIFIGMIYRDYLVSKEEREKLIQEEKEALLKLEKEKQEKYDVKNLFKNVEKEEKKELIEKQLVNAKEIPWYKKIFKKIIKIFEKK